jgi:hypothetical protein
MLLTETTCEIVASVGHSKCLFAALSSPLDLHSRTLTLALPARQARSGQRPKYLEILCIRPEFERVFGPHRDV